MASYENEINEIERLVKNKLDFYIDYPTKDNKNEFVKIKVLQSGFSLINSDMHYYFDITGILASYDTNTGNEEYNLDRQYVIDQLGDDISQITLNVFFSFDDDKYKPISIDLDINKLIESYSGKDIKVKITDINYKSYDIYPINTYFSKDRITKINMSGNIVDVKSFLLELGG